MIATLSGATGDPRHPVPTPQRSHLPARCTRSTAATPPCEQSRATQHAASRRLSCTSTQVPKALPHVPGPPGSPSPAPFPPSSEPFSVLCMDIPATLTSAFRPTTKVNAVISSYQKLRAVMNPLKVSGGSAKLQRHLTPMGHPWLGAGKGRAHLGMPRAFLAAGAVSGKKESELCDNDEI